MNLSDNELVIITPENKTYIEPMSGYYPATYGFENDEDGSFPMELIDDSTGGTSDVTVESEMAGHKKVLFHWCSGSSFSSPTINLSSPQTTGSTEYYVYKDSGYKGFEIILRNSIGGYALRISTTIIIDHNL